MILVHTLFVLSVIAGFGFVGAADTPAVKAEEPGDSTPVPPAPTVPPAADAAAAPTSTPTPAKAEEVPSEAARAAEVPKDVPKVEVEKKVETSDGARSVATKMLKEGIETSGDKIKSEESLNSAVDKIVDIIHQGEQSVNAKAEALPLSLGEKFDFLLLKIPKLAKKEEEAKKLKEEEKTGARGLNETPCNCNNNCPCLQQSAPVPAEANLNLNGLNPTQDYLDPNCPQAQLQRQQQQQLLSQLLGYRAFVGLNDYDGSRALDTLGPTYVQPYMQTVPASEYYGYANNYYNNHPIPYGQNSFDAYGTPYPLLASLYPEPQAGYNNNNLVYGYQKH
ncbi:hypothetical protein GE061_012252 [Apolygus lucorum]|uniref:Uncharacterized protein n=1 Tax=Apolygus lucorum TaxID=248454 RepID=A0A6A4JWW3_APOLU|nr:hypothetical protein GE061_012252 [Apolygus lucorum]